LVHSSNSDRLGDIIQLHLVEGSLRIWELITSNLKLIGLQQTNKVLQRYTFNPQKMYNKIFSLCIIEQILPLENRYRLVTDIHSKPDWHGTRYLMLVDNE